MNDFERRLLDVMQNSSYIASIARNNSKILAIDYFGYNTTISAVANGAVGQSLIPIQADSDFALTYMSAVAVVGGAVSSTTISLMQVTDTGTGKTFFNQATPMSLVTGSGGFPFLLPSPRVIAPNVNIKIDVTNMTGGVADYYISLMGARIYYGN